MLVRASRTTTRTLCTAMEVRERSVPRHLNSIGNALPENDTMKVQPNANARSNRFTHRPKSCCSILLTVIRNRS